MAQYNTWRHDNSKEGIFKRVSVCVSVVLLLLFGSILSYTFTVKH